MIIQVISTKTILQESPTFLVKKIILKTKLLGQTKSLIISDIISHKSIQEKSGLWSDFDNQTFLNVMVELYKTTRLFCVI